MAGEWSPLSAAPGVKWDPRIATDGAAGVIVTWTDYGEHPEGAIYAQHVPADGTIDSNWPVNGLAVCPQASGQGSSSILADVAGGAFIAWSDARSTATYSDIYMQHVLPGGTQDPAWPAGGLAVCTAVQGQSGITMVSDGAGNVILSWSDSRSGSSNTYAHHVLANGVVDPAWPTNGRAASSVTSYHATPTAVADGGGGVILAWDEDRTFTWKSYDIRVQHILANGTRDPLWPADGRVLCSAALNQVQPVIATDGAGGAIVTWRDERSGGDYLVGGDVYAQRVMANGSVDPSWPTDGVAICTAQNYQSNLAIAPDKVGGAIIIWQDHRNGATSGDIYPVDDIYAQRVTADGATVWQADGLPVCTATGGQGTPTIISDGGAGFIIAWGDARTGAYPDIYAQRVSRSGVLGGPNSSVSMDLDPDVINLSSGGRWVTAYLEPVGFDASAIDVSTVRLASSISAESNPVALSDRDGDGVPELKLKFDRQALTALLTLGINQVEVSGQLISGEEFAGSDEVQIIGQTSGEFSASVAPNPLNPVGRLKFRTSEPGEVSVRIFDLNGRLVRRVIEARYMASGDHVAGIDGRGENGEVLATGVYFYRVDTSRNSETGRFTILK